MITRSRQISHRKSAEKQKKSISDIKSAKNSKNDQIVEIAKILNIDQSDKNVHGRILENVIGVLKDSNDKFKNVHKPKHYTEKNIEVIEFLEQWFSDRPFEWQVVRYLARAPYKNNELEDLMKALWYLVRRIKNILGANNGDNQ